MTRALPTQAEAHQALKDYLARETAGPVPAFVTTFADALMRKFPGATIVYYGSAIGDQGTAAAVGNAVMDFYVLVADYRAAFAAPLLRLAARLLPPNVFYLEVPHGDVMLRAKYAVVSLPHFERLNSAQTFHSYFWARFAQAVRIVAAPDRAARQRAEESLARATETFCTTAACLVPDRFGPRDLWLAGLAASYSSELRAEGTDRAAAVLDRAPGRCEAITAWALRAAGREVDVTDDGRLTTRQTPAARRSALRGWHMRKLQGKLLSLARLAKATFTFDGGLDYILWKIERHSGVRVIPTDWQRRHPLVAAPILALKVYRRGGFR